MLYEVIGSPFVVGVDHDTVTKLVETLVVGAAGVAGFVAHKIETGELAILYPNAFKD